jgi:glycosyltransferase involved in cell wall biosynthesis
MKIWGNCIVNNEENFVWFSINSVIGHLDKILVWDTGSLDNTPKIIEEIQKKFPGKIEFKKVGKVSGLDYTKIRQKMLEESNCDWILILDGDEVWFGESIKRLIGEIKSNKDQLEALVVPFYNTVGDIYHYQEELAGKYHLLGRIGHQTLKAISRKIPGLHWDLPYPHEGLFNSNNKLIQDECRLKFIDTPFLHTSLLERSAFKKINKRKLELGLKFPGNFSYPEVFYKEYPDFIKSPFKKLSGSDLILANVLTPLKKIKRRLKK